FQPQLLDTRYFLGSGVVDDVSYVGPSERLVVRLMLWSPAERSLSPKPRLAPVDEGYVDGFPIIITRSKWEASEMELSVGDPIVVALKDYRQLPHYPLRSESG